MNSPDDEEPLIGTGPRLVSPTEYATLLSVSEDDVRGWIAEGKLPTEPGPDGEPWLRIIDEAHEEDDGVAVGFVMYSTGSLRSDEIGVRRRDRELESYSYDGPIDADALVAALARRLADVVPDAAVEAPYRGMVYGVDVAQWLSGSEDGSTEELVAAIAAQVMENSRSAWPTRRPSRGLHEPASSRAALPRWGRRCVTGWSGCGGGRLRRRCWSSSRFRLRRC